MPTRSVAMRTFRHSSAGFTLIELMVVIVIIGILVAIALPNFIASQDRAKQASVKSNAHTLQVAVETYNVDWGSYPDTISGITSLDGYKVFTNPFTSDEGVMSVGRGAWRTSEYGAVGSPGDLLNNYNDDWASKGLVMYVGLNAENEATTTLMGANGTLAANPPATVSYMIFGCDGRGETIRRFILSPGPLTPKGEQLKSAS